MKERTCACTITSTCKVYGKLINFIFSQLIINRRHALLTLTEMTVVASAFVAAEIACVIALIGLVSVCVINH